ncbi:hypothetical protein PAHAL_8G005000 [Panicum hallii]|uniref:Uncharacterized protein n=1 Tax=Panicum hallii TaxID=206008 RepID=A0A2T8I714_9POAL|nr:hypothetical protein PAHAL_8G005000 [Panicum hallii]
MPSSWTSFLVCLHLHWISWIWPWSFLMGLGWPLELCSCLSYEGLHLKLLPGPFWRK